MVRGLDSSSFLFDTFFVTRSKSALWSWQQIAEVNCHILFVAVTATNLRKVPSCQKDQILCLFTFRVQFGRPCLNPFVRSHLCTVIVLVLVASYHYLYGIVLTTWLCMCLCRSVQIVMLVSIILSFLFYMYISLQINIKNLSCVHHCQRP